MSSIIAFFQYAKANARQLLPLPSACCWCALAPAAISCDWQTADTALQYPSNYHQRTFSNTGCRNSICNKQPLQVALHKQRENQDKPTRQQNGSYRHQRPGCRWSECRPVLCRRHQNHLDRSAMSAQEDRSAYIFHSLFPKEQHWCLLAASQASRLHFQVGRYSPRFLFLLQPLAQSGQPLCIAHHWKSRYPL